MTKSVKNGHGDYGDFIYEILDIFYKNYIDCYVKNVYSLY